ncbi:MAG: tetratricopeptide repeat protein [Verrucomicrobiota bacterium]
MKTIFAIIALLFFALPAKASQTQSETFLMAQSAYDAGRYAEAATLYSGLASNGIDNVELHYNLANAQFKNGNLPEAVLHYRKAWYKAPRDPDINANLHFALNAAGAVEPGRSVFERLFNLLPQNEWVTIAAGGYILITLLLAFGMLLPPTKRTLFRTSLVFAVLALTALGGWWHWQKLNSNPEWVVVTPGATTFYGPIEGSTAHYKIPLAALVRQCSTNPKGWIEVEYDGKRGWLKKGTIKRIYP